MGKSQLVLIEEIEELGDLIDEYPVDESQTNSNAGDAKVYAYLGEEYEITTWNDRANRHDEDEQEIAKL